MIEEQANEDKPSGYRYWAFISYSSKDRQWARWLHRSIETYGIPAQLIRHPTPMGEPAPKRFFPLFHDRSELPASADLGHEIEGALRDSRYLIVICSPHAVQSRWVGKEIETFRRLHSNHRILALIVAGEANSGDARECFPGELRQFEPIAADARPEGDGRANSLLKLLAGMLGVGFDALKQRDLARRQARLKRWLAGTLLLAGIMAGLAVAALRAREEARRQKTVAEGNAYRASLSGGAAALATGDAETAERTLALSPAPLRGWEWRLLQAQTDASIGTLAGHEGIVNTVAWSRDGTRLATGGEDRTVRLWNWPGTNEAVVLRGHTRGLRSVSFSLDGTRVVSGAADGTIRLWDARRGTLLTGRNEHQPEVTSVMFTPVGDWILTCGADGRVLLWDGRLEQARVVLSLRSPNQNGHTLQTLAVSHDGRLAAVGDFLGQIHLLKLTSAEPLLRTWKAHSQMIIGLTFSENDEVLACASLDATVTLWEVGTGRLQGTFRGHQSAVKSAQFLGGGTRMVSAARDRSLRIWNKDTLNQETLLIGHRATINALALHPQTQLAVSVSADGFCKIWDLSQTNPGRLAPMRRDPDPGLPADPAQASRVVVSRAGERLATLASDGVRVWDSRQSVELGWIRDFVDESVALRPDGREVAWKSQPGEIRGWDLEGWRQTFQIQGVSHSLPSLDYSPDGLRLAGGSGDGQVSVWDLQTTNRLNLKTGHSNALWRVRFSPDGAVVAASSTYNHVRVWDSRTGALLGQYANGGSNWLFDIAFRPAMGSSELLIATHDGSCRLWDWKTGKELRKFVADRFIVFALAWHPDGTRFVSGHADGSIRTWDPNTGEQLLILPAHAGPVTDLVFAPGGGRLYSCPLRLSGSDHVRVWEVSPESSRRAARREDTRLLNEARQWLRRTELQALLNEEPAKVAGRIRTEFGQNEHMRWAALTALAEQVAAGQTRIPRDPKDFQRGTQR